MWQPISTAPKDRDILVYTDKNQTGVVFWLKNHWKLCCVERQSMFGEPTHWMSIPVAPISGINFKKNE